MIDWSKGFSARYYAREIDPITWSISSGDIDIKSGSISRSFNDLRESADLECGNYDFSNEHWLRIFLDIDQSGESHQEILFTGLTSSPSINIQGEKVNNKVICYSVLKPESDILLERGWFAPGNSNCGELIRSLFKNTPAPLEISEEEKYLDANIIAEEGETNLSMANKILDYIDWRMYIRGDGTIVVGPYPYDLKYRMPSAVSVYFDSVNNDCLETQIDLTNDWYNCPNVFRAVIGNSVALARDENEDSRFSIDNRGREIWMEEVNPTLNEAETLAEYAFRRLKEEQTVAYSASYSRRYTPDVNLGDVIYLNYPKQGIIGNFIVDSQNITLGYGATVSEVVYKL